MGISKEQFRDRDIFIDYPYEEVMFRFDHTARVFFRKLYGNAKESSVPHDNRLLNDAIRFGDETDAAAYAAGKLRT